MNSPREIKISTDLMRGGQHNTAKVIAIDGKPPLYPQVLKWPHSLGRWESSSPKDARSDLSVLETLPVSIPRTEIFDDVVMDFDGGVTRSPYIMLQEFVEGPEVEESDFDVFEVRDQVRTALLASWEMYIRDGMAVDFLGQAAAKGYVDFFRNPVKNPLKIHNMIKVSPEDVKLIDTRLFVPKRLKPGIEQIVTILAELSHFGIANILNNHSSASDQIYLDGGSSGIRKFTGLLSSAAVLRK